MAKNEEKNAESSPPQPPETADSGVQPQLPPKKRAPKNRVKTMQMMVGVDLIGAAMSMASGRNLELEATAIGIKMYSKKTRRTIVIPYSNVKGFELFPEDEA